MLPRRPRAAAQGERGGGRAGGRAHGQAWAAQRLMPAQGSSLERVQQLSAELLGVQETPAVQVDRNERRQQRRRRVPEQVIAKETPENLALVVQWKRVQQRTVEQIVDARAGQFVEQTAYVPLPSRSGTPSAAASTLDRCGVLRRIGGFRTFSPQEKCEERAAPEYELARALEAVHGGRL